MSEIIRIPLKQIEVDKDQPRKTFQEIRDLAKSILRQGLLEPLKVVRITPRSYMLLDGERRYKALEILSKKDEQYSVANSIILQPRNNKVITQLSFDVQKNKIPILEEAEAYKSLLQDSYSVKELGVLMGKHAGYIKGRLKISSLSNQTKEHIKNKELPAGIFSLIDIDSLKQSEEKIIDRIIEEKAKRYPEIDRIIKEETQKAESMIHFFVSDLVKLKNRIEEFERRSESIELPSIPEMLGVTLTEAKTTLDRFLSNLHKFYEIEDEAKLLKDKLDGLLNKYGKGTEVTKELVDKEFTPQSETEEGK